MHRHGDGFLIVACVVIGLLMLAVHNGHPAFVPTGWCGARAVSASYVMHMAELEIRHWAARLGQVVSVR